MPGFYKKNLVRRAAWCFASLLLSACEVGSSTKALTPYRAPSSANTAVSAGNGTAEVGSSMSVQVKVNDKNGYGIANVTPTINAVNNATQSSTGVTSGGCSVTSQLGVATCSLRATIAGSYTIKVLTPVQTTMSTAVTFFQVPRRLSFNAFSSSTVSQLVMGVQPAVTVLDALGVAIPGGKTTGSAGTGSVTITLNGSTGGLLSGVNVATASAGGGIATFAGINVDIAGSYTLTASLSDPIGGTITGTSASFSIIAGPAVGFIFTSVPAAVSTGTAFTPQPVVKEVDAKGNIATSDSTCVVQIGVSGANVGDQLQGTVLSKTMAGGVADFAGNNLRISRIGTGTNGQMYQLTATGTSATCMNFSGISTAFNVSLVGLVSQLTITQAPGTAALNETWSQQPIIKVLDNTGAVVTSDNSTTVIMTISAFTGGSQGVLVGTSTVQTVNGVATFSALSIPATQAQSAFAGTYTYKFAGFNGSLSIASASTQQVITVNGLIPAGVRFKSQPPGSVSVKQPMAAFEVQTIDALGYPCLFDQDSLIDLGVNATSLGTVMAPTQSAVRVVNGSAVFTGLFFDRAGAVQIVAHRETSPISTDAYSSVFTVATHGTRDHLLFAQSPSGAATHGAAWTPQPIVYVVDAQGNVVTDDNDTVVKLECVLPIDCTGKLVGNTSLRVTNGIANFTGVGIHLSGGAWQGTVPTNEMIEASGTPVLPVAPSFSGEFPEN